MSLVRYNSIHIREEKRECNRTEEEEDWLETRGEKGLQVDLIAGEVL